jgi:predicted DNA-binding WGR domain protein
MLNAEDIADEPSALAFPSEVALTRFRPERNEWRFYRLAVWPGLFGDMLLARHWGRIGTAGRLRLDSHPDAAAALHVLVLQWGQNELQIGLRRGGNVRTGESIAAFGFRTPRKRSF